MFNAVFIFLFHVLLCKKLALNLAEWKRNLFKEHCKYKVWSQMDASESFRHKPVTPDSNHLQGSILTLATDSTDVLVIQMYHDKCIISQ